VEGYQVIGSDDAKLGQVVAVDDDLVIVEHGTLRKSRHAVPDAFTHVDDGEQVVRLSITKEIVADSPAVEGDEVDREAVAAHYGLAEAFEQPETEGYGEVTPDDPALSSEQQAARDGVEPAAQHRARMREGETADAGPHGRQIIPPDPHEGP
jgi:hypothetical protein